MNTQDGAICIDNCHNKRLHPKFDAFGFRGLVGSIKKHPDKIIYVCKVDGIDEELITHSDDWDMLYSQFAGMVSEYKQRNLLNETNNGVVKPVYREVGSFSYQVNQDSQKHITQGTVLAVTSEDAFMYVSNKFGISKDVAYLTIQINPCWSFSSEFTELAKQVVCNGQSYS